MVAAALNSAIVQFSFALGSLVYENFTLPLSHGGAIKRLFGASVFNLTSTPLFYSLHYTSFPFFKGCRLEKGHIVPVLFSHS